MNLEQYSKDRFFHGFFFCLIILSSPLVAMYGLVWMDKSNLDRERTELYTTKEEMESALRQRELELNKVQNRVSGMTESSQAILVKIKEQSDELEGRLSDVRRRERRVEEILASLTPEQEYKRLVGEFIKEGVSFSPCISYPSLESFNRAKNIFNQLYSVSKETNNKQHVEYVKSLMPNGQPRYCG